MSETPEELPLFPLKTVLFPGQPLPLHIFEERYKQMIGACLDEGAPFGVVLIRFGEEVGGPAVPHEVGTLASIVDVQRLEDGRLNLVAVGRRRFRVQDIVKREPYLQARVEHLTSEGAELASEEASGVAALFSEGYRLSLALANQWSRTLRLPSNPDILADLVASRLDVDPAAKQELLEALWVPRRLALEKEILGVQLRLLTEQVRHHHRARLAGFGVLN